MDMQPSYHLWGWILPLLFIVAVLAMLQAAIQLSRVQRWVETASCCGVALFFAFLAHLSSGFWFAS